MRNDITLMDGGQGTTLWKKAKEQVAVWRYNIEDPDIVFEMMREYADAGSQIVSTNTFSANGPSMEGTGHNVEEIMAAGLEIAHSALDGRAKIALDVGPLTGLLKPFGTISDEEAHEIFEEQISAGMKGKPDLILLETFLDLKMMQIAASIASKYDIPLFCSMTFAKYSPKKGARTMMGNSIQDIIDGLREYEPAAIGLNCSMGPEETLPIIAEFSEKSDIPLLYKPNAGKPTLEGGTEIDFTLFANAVSKAAELENVKYMGGCCGSTPRYIGALKEKLNRE